MEKKKSYLRQTVMQMQLQNVNVAAGKAEEQVALNKDAMIALIEENLSGATLTNGVDANGSVRAGRQAAASGGGYRNVAGERGKEYFKAIDANKDPASERKRIATEIYNNIFGAADANGDKVYTKEEVFLALERTNDLMFMINNSAGEISVEDLNNTARFGNTFNWIKPVSSTAYVGGATTGTEHYIYSDEVPINSSLTSLAAKAPISTPAVGTNPAAGAPAAATTVNNPPAAPVENTKFFDFGTLFSKSNVDHSQDPVAVDKTAMIKLIGDNIPDVIAISEVDKYNKDPKNKGKALDAVQWKKKTAEYIYDTDFASHEKDDNAAGFTRAEAWEGLKVVNQSLAQYNTEISQEELTANSAVFSWVKAGAAAKDKTAEHSLSYDPSADKENQNPLQGIIDMIKGFIDQLKNWFGGHDGQSAMSDAASQNAGVQAAVKDPLDKAAADATNNPGFDGALATKKSMELAAADPANQKELASHAAGDADKAMVELRKKVLDLAKQYENDPKTFGIERDKLVDDYLKKLAVPKEIDMTGVKVKLVDKDGHPIDAAGHRLGANGFTLDGTDKETTTKGGAQAEITLSGQKIAVSDLGAQQSVYEGLYTAEALKEGAALKAVTLDEAKKERTQQAILDGAREVYKHGLTLTENGKRRPVDVDEQSIQGAKLVYYMEDTKNQGTFIICKAGERSNAMAAVDVNTGNVYSVAGGVVGAEIKFDKVDYQNPGKHPDAKFVGSMGADILVANRKNFLNSMVYNHGEGQPTEVERISSAHFTEIAKNAGLDGMTTVGMSQSLLNNVVNILEQGAKQNPPIDISKIKLSPELSDVLLNPNDPAAADKLWQKFNSEGEAAFFQDKSWGSRIDVEHKNMKAGTFEQGGQTVKGYKNKDGLAFTEGQFNELRHMAEDASSGKNYVKERQEENLANRALFEKATLGDLRDAIRMGNEIMLNGKYVDDKGIEHKSLEQPYAALYARAYLTLKSHYEKRAGYDETPEEITTDLARMADRIEHKHGGFAGIGKKDASRILIVENPNEADDKKDLNILSNLSLNMGDNFVPTRDNLNNLTVPQDLRTNNFYSRDVAQDNLRWNNDVKHRVVENMPFEEKAKLLRRAIYKQAYGDLGENLSDAMIETIVNAGAQGANKAPVYNLGGITIDLRNPAQRSNAALGQYFDQVIYNNCKPFDEVVTEYLTDQFDVTAAGAKIERKGGAYADKERRIGKEEAKEDPRDRQVDEKSTTVQSGDMKTGEVNLESKLNSIFAGVTDANLKAQLAEVVRDMAEFKGDITARPASSQDMAVKDFYADMDKLKLMAGDKQAEMADIIAGVRKTGAYKD